MRPQCDHHSSTHEAGRFRGATETACHLRKHGDQSVGLVVHYSNFPEIADDLRRCVERLGRAKQSRQPVTTSVRSTGKSEQVWRVRDRLTEAQQQALVGAFRDGVGQQELADRYGVSLSGVRRLLRSMGVRRRGEPLSERERRAIVEAFLNGARQRDLAAKYGVSQSTIKRLLRSVGARR